MYFENIPVFSELNLFSILFRIALALILGGALGIEREQKQHPAGFRTYVIVCLGATLACITNLYMCERLGGTDPARIPAQVISRWNDSCHTQQSCPRSDHCRRALVLCHDWHCRRLRLLLRCCFMYGYDYIFPAYFIAR